MFDKVLSTSLVSKVFSGTLKLIANRTNYLDQGVLAQLAFICSKATIETVEKGVKYIQS